MKVLGDPEAWMVERTCSGCKVRLRIELSDVVIEDQVKATCIKCNRELLLGDPNHLPSAVQKILRRKNRK
jgi:hypothetical protein